MLTVAPIRDMAGRARFVGVQVDVTAHPEASAPPMAPPPPTRKRAA